MSPRGPHKAAWKRLADDLYEVKRAGFDECGVSLRYRLAQWRGVAEALGVDPDHPGAAAECRAQAMALRLNLEEQAATLRRLRDDLAMERAARKEAEAKFTASHEFGWKAIQAVGEGRMQRDALEDELAAMRGERAPEEAWTFGVSREWVRHLLGGIVLRVGTDGAWVALSPADPGRPFARGKADRLTGPIGAFTQCMRAVAKEWLWRHGRWLRDIGDVEMVVWPNGQWEAYERDLQRELVWSKGGQADALLGPSSAFEQAVAVAKEAADGN